ncbi:conserved hypothetical protein [Salmonella enterica subsp. enterica serovar Newport str. SL317]|uniref:YdaE family protein n=1 Tax=Salmonella enterica TaxID=28901 RepID=UPI00016C06B4|nr:YdaE family protein [Salmonella enterica]EDX49490.1 conserved hypothetical protein [Salmonella enterica subsp. enterica serovar Newport str. SL317]
MLKQCGYCRNPLIRQRSKNELTLIRGAQLTHEERDYCSVRCASYDQMAHES